MIDDKPQTWAEVWALEPGTYSWIQTAPLAWQPEDTPTDTIRVELEVQRGTEANTSRACKLSYIDGATNLTRYFGEDGVSAAASGRWAKIATATPPQEYDLPLAEGFTSGGNANTYWKDQFGVVHVEFCVQKSSSTYELNDVFATLPAGFRPKRRVHVGGIGDGITAGTGVIAMEVCIEPNGSMFLYCANSTIHWVVGEMSFLAAD